MTATELAALYTVATIAWLDGRHNDAVRAVERARRERRDASPRVTEDRRVVDALDALAAALREKTTPRAGHVASDLLDRLAKREREPRGEGKDSNV